MISQASADEIDLRQYIKVIGKNWKLIAGLAVALALLALVFSLRQKPVYETSASVLLRGGSAAGLSQYAGLAGLLGVNVGGGSAGGTADLSDLLQSRAVAAKVLDSLNLTARIKGWDQPGVKRANLISAVGGMLMKPKLSDNILEIRVRTGDPQLSADVANGFVDALGYYWNELNSTEARNKLSYIESELPRVERDLRVTEDKLKLMPHAAGYSFSGEGGIQRDYDLYNSVYTMLRKEKESAKLEAAKEIPPFSVIDRAEKPLSRSGPKVKLNVMIGFALGLFSGTLIAFFREYWDRTA